MINASARLHASNIYKVGDVLSKFIKVSPQYGVGQGAYAYSAKVPEAELNSFLRKLKPLQFKAAKWNRQLLPLAKANGAKIYVSWNADLSQYATYTSEGWATFMIVVPESTCVAVMFQTVRFAKLIK